VTGGTCQTTGRGELLGLEANYRELFRGQFQLNVGSSVGVLITAQTEANLHIALGGTVVYFKSGSRTLFIAV
jgi:putative ABC transport system permease protein